MTKTTGKKRISPSVERQLALALLRIIECVGNVDIATDQDAYPDLSNSIAKGIEVLDANGYKDMESIPTRVRRIEVEIAGALKDRDGAKLAQLGAMLDRAKKGLPPLATEKKPRTPRKPNTRKKKDDTNLLPIEESGSAAESEA